MIQGLWDWQDEDVRRLRRQQKDELAQCWDRFELDNDLEGAVVLLLDSRPTPPPLSSEAVRIALALAEANARWEQWSESRSHAERALTAARTRGMVRYAAEAALWAAEACREEGDSEGQARYSTELKLLLPQLGSRDLDERARGLTAD